MPVGVYKRTKYHLDILKKARENITHRGMSESTKIKICLANRGIWIKYNCDYCSKENEEKQSHYKRKKRHFCSMECYTKYRKEIMPPNECNSYKGIRKPGESKQVYHRRYVQSHKINIAHLKARRYAKEKGALGNHTLQEWENLKKLHNFKCVKCGEIKKLTKDHIIPLSKGGSDFIENIQPLCKNCNSKKWANIENPELLEEVK